MQNPKYKLSESIDTIRRNLLKIFPMVNNNFCIHIVKENHIIDIKDFDIAIMKELCAIITLGEDFKYLSEMIEDTFPNRKGELKENRKQYEEKLELTNNFGELKEYQFVLKGWIGTYKTTRGRKSSLVDFPDNFISVFANKKLGEFNILPLVGQNKLNEVYVVGQLHVDIFEETELPDMALSNRQGYKSDDPRYTKLLNYVRDILLVDILKKRELFVDLQKVEKKKKNEADLKKKENDLKKSVDAFRINTSKDIAKKLSSKKNSTATEKEIEDLISQTINDNSPDLGLKKIIDSGKKKILISHTFADKQLADIIYSMLIYNNIPSIDILYTSCDDEISRIPEGEKVYEYLKKFFVESYSTQKIYVLFVTSENTKSSWGAITEIGAAWITQIENKIFNIPPFHPEHPLDDERIWQITNREKDELSMTNLNADIFCQKIEDVCKHLGYKYKERSDNITYLKKLVRVE